MRSSSLRVHYYSAGVKRYAAVVMDGFDERLCFCNFPLRCLLRLAILHPSQSTQATVSSNQKSSKFPKFFPCSWIVHAYTPILWVHACVLVCNAYVCVHVRVSARVFECVIRAVWSAQLVPVQLEEAAATPARLLL